MFLITCYFFMRFIYTKAFTIFFSLFVGIALLFILDRTGYLNFFKDNFSRGYGSGVRLVSAGTSGVKEIFTTLGTIRSLARENAELALRIDELSFENARLLASKQENAALRKALNFADTSSFNAVPVEVIASDPTGFTKTITISKGIKDGIALNMPVVSSPGLLVGRITRLGNTTSEATLITDPSMVINAEVADSGARGIIKGEHGLSLSFDLVTQNELIKAQDRIITSGLSADFPRGLYIGEIAGIRSSASELFQKAYVIPAADLRNLKYLFVIQ